MTSCPHLCSHSCLGVTHLLLYIVKEEGHELESEWGPGTEGDRGGERQEWCKYNAHVWKPQNVI